MSLDAKRQQKAGDAPPPEPRQWDEPPLALPGLPDVPSFPLHTLPAPLQEYVSDVARATNTPIDYPACFALAIAAGTIGATNAVTIKAGHVQRSSLYLCAVAQKGSGKTPALDAVADPVYDHQAQLYRERERKRKAFVGDITAEKLAQVLHENPRGALMIRDELASWLMSFNQYKAGGKGSDRQFYLSAWSGSPVSVDRVKDKDAEPLFVRFPCLSVVGTIQPSVFDRFRGDADDGFYDRVLFCFPDELPLAGEKWDTITPARAKSWADALGRLRALPMIHDLGADFDRPDFLHLDLDARCSWQLWTESVAATVNADDFDPTLRGPAVKLSGYAARLALVAHLLRQVYDETKFRGIDGEDMQRGADLGAYFLGHARRAWAAVGLDSRHAGLRRLVRWITERNGNPFTRRDAHRALQRTFPDSEALTKPLSTLVQLGYLRYQETLPVSAQDKSRGRPAGVVYEIHPELCQRVIMSPCQRQPAASDGTGPALT